MKKLIFKFFILVALILYVSCSPVQFYPNSELTKKSGLKYYTVKPYLLVDRETAGNNIVKASVVYLPDLENPQYLVLNNGLASRKVDLKLSDGAINSFGLSTDPLIAESVEALSALISKSASAIEDISGLKGVPPMAAASTVTELYEIIMSGGATSVKKIEIK